MTSSTDGASLSGRMAKCMKDSSETTSDMVQAPTNTQVERWGSLCGLMVRSTTDFTASKKRNIDAGTLENRVNNDGLILFKHGLDG